MNKSIIAAAIGAVLSRPDAFADGVVYGKIHTSVHE